MFTKSDEKRKLLESQIKQLLQINTNLAQQNIHDDASIAGSIQKHALHRHLMRPESKGGDATKTRKILTPAKDFAATSVAAVSKPGGDSTACPQWFTASELAAAGCPGADVSSQR